MYQGREIDADEAVDLLSRRVDISKLDPAPNDAWTSEISPTWDQEDAGLGYPAPGAEVEFDTKLGSIQGIFQSRVVVQEGELRRPFRLYVSLTTHAALARNALLRRLGYRIPTPRYYSSLKIRFASLTKRESFLNSVSDFTLTARQRWIRELPETEPTVTLQDVVLEPSQIDSAPYHWGVIEPDYLDDKRALRALLLPTVLLDIPESINLFSTELGKILSESVLLTSNYADSFSETTFQDLQWIARRIASISRSEWISIIRLGKYPPDISTLLLEKVIARRNHLVALLRIARSIERPSRILPYDMNVNLGYVRHGKLTHSSYEGYAARFAYGDPDSPLTGSELLKYFFLNTLTGGFSAATNQLNQKLQVQTTNDVAMQHQNELVRNAYEHFRQNPNQPLSQTLSAWGGPFGGFGIQANRSVITGNYFGSSAKIQLVDSFGISGSVGYFMGFDGVPTVIPSVSGNLTIQRNYVHIKPITEMKEGLKTDWSLIFVPRFLAQLSALMDPPNAKKGEGPEFTPEYVKAHLDPFLDALQENEILLITDSISVAARGAVNIPIPVIPDPSLVVFNPNAGVALAARPSGLRRTMISRTKNGLQIYFQSAKTASVEAELNFNWWLNVLKLSHETRWSGDNTRAYILDETVTKADDSQKEEIRKKLLLSMRALIGSNDSEILEENFKDYRIHHRLDVGINKAKLLWGRHYSLNEDHRVRVEPPGYPDKARTLFSKRYVTNSGISPYSFLNDIVVASSSGIVSLPNNSGLNPAYSPFGNASWTNISTEAETTPNYPNNYISSIEQHWGGWILPKQNLMKIIDHLESKTQSLHLEQPMIRRDEFNSTSHLEFYDISSSLLIYESGIQQILDLLLKPKLLETVEGLTDIEGKEELKQWCSQAGRAVLDALFFVNSFTDQDMGHTIRFKCLKSWMRAALKVRRDILNHAYPDTPEGRTDWQNTLVRELSTEMEFDKFLHWLGKENYFFQIKVSGFRAKDENGDTDYISDSLGTFKEKEGAGAFRDFATKYGISTYELYARYLAEGYSGY